MRHAFIHSIVAFILGATVFLSAAEALETKAKQAILVDTATDTVLFEKNADALMHPSSMSKLMTVYMLFKHLKEGGLKLTDTFTVSEKAWRMQGSKSWVDINTQVAVEDLIRGIVIQSGNDACVVVAEGLAGSEEAFAKLMNEEAKKIGLTGSHFVNATGWPDERHLMTSRDLAILARRLIQDFPEYYHYFAEPDFTYHNIHQPNRNVLLQRGIGVDGLKTGHTEDGGYGITVSAKDEQGRRLIVVVNGLADDKERAQEAEALVRAGFRDFETVTIAPRDTVIETAELWLGRKESVPLVADKDLRVTIPRLGRKDIKMTVSYNSPVPAPVAKGAHLADLVVAVPGQGTQTIPLVAAEAVEKLNPVARILPGLSYRLLGH